MKNIISINRGTKMKIVRYLFIPLIAIALIVSGCSKSEESGKHEHELVKKDGYWTCTMHPQVHMDKPGSCPICGMDLIKKVADETPEAVNDKDMANMVTLSGKKQVLANVSTVYVKKENLQEQVTAYSFLDFVENNSKTISARFNGRIEKLLVDKTGDYVKKGQPLFEIYSPDLVQAQNEYLIALNNSQNSSLQKAAKKKLEIFGLTQDQIQTLEKTKEINLTLTYFSPFSGTVIEKKVQEGVYVNEGTAIYDMAELSTLWNIAEVYENNLSNVKVGSPVKLHLRAYPGEEFNGRVTFIYPVINSQTRTVKVRSEFASLGGKLKPQMYGETIFNSAGGQGLLVPADAVIIAGKRTVVWAKAGDGMFEARTVQIGNRFGDKYQILSGLNEGDEIAATGGFLIDSESQLKTGMPTGHQHGGSAPTQQKKTSDGMEGMKM
ncbi:MAG: Cu(I)/Ag(I) efflux system membrane protein CusB [Ignavibacteria bacterium]|nr:MAG: Cu(I)/Ag(I) efflux system membrane protein CusB [Ignavibacteria bacterium]KAF0162497.1 MAG: Cu(I)/Ag(I) efflux system membrane protein CusB [Ignavibacteria bacterium]